MFMHVICPWFMYYLFLEHSDLLYCTCTWLIHSHCLGFCSDVFIQAKIMCLPTIFPLSCPFHLTNHHILKILRLSTFTVNYLNFSYLTNTYLQDWYSCSPGKTKAKRD